MIKVVSFDLGKTLIKPVIQNSRLCKYIADNLKVSYTIMKPFYRSHFLERRISLSEFCAALGEDNQEKVLCLIENYYSEKKYNGIYEDVLPTLSKLKAKGYRLVCISNKPYCNFTYLSTYNLGSFFEAEIYSCDVGVAKPRPQIFQKVQSLLGISSTEIVHVGDSLEGDVIGALCANWQAVYLNRSVAIDGVKVDGFKFYSIINSLLQLPLVLENLNN